MAKKDLTKRNIFFGGLGLVWGLAVIVFWLVKEGTVAPVGVVLAVVGGIYLWKGLQAKRGPAVDETNTTKTSS